jgi:hypothetical protein
LNTWASGSVIPIAIGCRQLQDQEFSEDAGVKNRVEPIVVKRFERAPAICDQANEAKQLPYNFISGGDIT